MKDFLSLLLHKQVKKKVTRNFFACAYSVVWDAVDPNQLNTKY